MIVQPRIRGFICTTAHPVGCAKHIQDQIDFVKSQKPVLNGPKKVLVVGSSTGYGLASRIVASFGGSNAATVGVFFEKEPEEKRTATAGWYNMVAFEEKAHKAGLYAKSFNGDAFSDEIKQRVVEAVKKDLGKLDLIIYSLASPRRQNPKTGEISKSVLRPIGASYTNQSLDVSVNKLETVTLPEATQEEIRQTIDVMGGEDWEEWINVLEKADLVEQGVKTVAYSYIGPEVTRAIYRNGTIGRAKDHLEATAKKLDQRLKSKNGHALISVNKALVTQSSSAIPFIPLYFVMLKKAMKERNIEEDCIHQIYRMFASRLYMIPEIPVDENGFIRMDDWEMKPDVQREVQQAWDQLTQENYQSFGDIKGYQEDFLKLFGFGLSGVDYNADVEVDLKIPSI